MADKVIWTPRGVDRRQAPVGLPERAGDSRNFLFQDNQCFSRPGLTSTALTGITANHRIMSAQRVKTDFAEQVMALSFYYVGPAYKTWTINAGNVATEITGGGTVGDAYFEGFLGDVFMANTSGIWSSTGGAAWVNRNVAPYSLLTRHLTRLIAANPSTRTIGWSVVGNGYDWASSGSGTNLLAHINDRIILICTIKNMLVILRQTGITIGYPTGTSSPAFRFEDFVSDFDLYDGGACCLGNYLYWVGASNVYRFDGSQIESFGDEIIGDYMHFSRSSAAGVSYKGLATFVEAAWWYTVTGVATTHPRLVYHLIPIIPYSPLTPSLIKEPHYVYDFLEKSWSIHSYGNIDWTAAHSTPNNRQPRMYSRTSNALTYEWARDTVIEQEAYVESNEIPLGEEDVDALLERVLITFRDIGQTTITVSITSTLNDGTVTGSPTLLIGNGLNDGVLRRKWLDIRQAGQFYKVRVTVPASVRANFVMFRFVFDKSGDFRG